MQDYKSLDREGRGALLAANVKIVQRNGYWAVPSQSTGTQRYTVDPSEQSPHCNCPDHELHGCVCKHIYAVRLVIQRELFDDGTEAVTQSVTVSATTVRKTYAQNWKAYNSAQTTEKTAFQALLHELCQGIEEPEQKMERPRMPLQDAIFAACFKVYSTMSGRRFVTDMRESHEEGFVGRCPSYNMIFKVFESEATFEIVKPLVFESAAPLQSLETKFACDSSGFSGCRYDRWFDHRYGKTPIPTQRRAWVKAHVMVGVKTNVIAAVEIHEQDANDGAQLPALLETTAAQFTITEVSADKAYSHKANLAKVDSIGATPLIPFRKNANPAKGGLWGKMYHYFQLQREEFAARYHLRSNVESVFSAVKRKFGDSVRSKTDIAMKNEVLAKLVCHNICCIIQEMHESGIDPTFWKSRKLGCPQNNSLAYKVAGN